MSVRGVRQLSHLFLSYKPGQPSSRVVEEFLQSPLLQQFKDKHPGVVVDTLKTVKNNPFLSASYVNKHGSQLSLVDCRTPEGVLSLCQRLANQIGRAPGMLGSIKRKPFPQTATRSLQGAWQPTFGLKSNEEQLKPLAQVQTHIIGMAPPMDAANATKAAPSAAPKASKKQ